MTTQTNEQKRERKTSSDSPQARSNKRRDKANTTNHGPRDPCLSTQRWCWLHSISTTMNPSNKRTGSHTNTPATDATNPSNHFIFPSVDGATYYSAGGGRGHKEIAAKLCIAANEKERRNKYEEKRRRKKEGSEREHTEMDSRNTTANTVSHRFVTSHTPPRVFDILLLYRH